MAAYLQLGLNHVICCDHKFQFRSRLFSEPTLQCPLYLLPDLMCLGTRALAPPSPPPDFTFCRVWIINISRHRRHGSITEQTMIRFISVYRNTGPFSSSPQPVCCKKVALANLVFIHNAWGCHPGTERGWCQMVTCTNTGLMNTPPPTLMVIKSSHG